MFLMLCLSAAAAQTQTATVAPKKEPAKKETPRKVEIKGPYILIDARTGDVLAQDRAGEPWYPASLSKLMTSYVVFNKIKEGKLRLDQLITVSPLASSQEPSKLGLAAGQTISVDLALQTMLVYSANDMAYVLAEAASGSIADFAGDMNGAAHRLGLSASHFMNPNGLFDPRQVTSARDMAVLSAVLVAEFPEHAHYFMQQSVAIGKRQLPNRNRLIRVMKGADGMKTGFVCASGFNLVASATREGRRLIAVVMGYKNSTARAEAAQALLNLGFTSPIPEGAVKAADVVNLPQGAIVPSDLTPTFCKDKPLVSLKDGSTLEGWGISFGTYETSMKADMALRGRLLSPAGIDAKVLSGVIYLPEKKGFGAWLWNLDEATSQDLCKSYRQDGAHCEVLTPDIMEQVGREARAKRLAAIAAAEEKKRLAFLAALYKRQIGH